MDIDTRVRAILGAVLVAAAACGCDDEPELDAADYVAPATETVMAALQDACDEECADCVSITAQVVGDEVRCVGERDDGTALDVVSDALAQLQPWELECPLGCADAPAIDALHGAGYTPHIGGCSAYAESGALWLSCEISSTCDAGRRPSAGAPAHRAIRGEADHWRAMAELEAAAVTAFLELAQVLAHHGAPAALIDRAKAAADDERRHAEVCARLGGIATPVVPPVPAVPLSLVALAELNAREGCVLESFAALQLAWQARHCGDRARSRALAAIALDEAQHAALAWDVDRWVATRLDAAQRERVARVRAAAIEALPRFDGAGTGVDAPARAALRRERAAFVAAL